MQIRCSKCGSLMDCDPGNCWCDKLPSLRELEAGVGCLCPACLQEQLARQATAEKMAAQD
jgi:hypothetical protein